MASPLVCGAFSDCELLLQTIEGFLLFIEASRGAEWWEAVVVFVEVLRSQC